MTDIDFDELDRAVNSLIGPDSAKQEAVQTAQVTPVAVSSSVPVSSSPASTAPSSTPPLAERRSSGRFMDVVHPSSDMRSNNSVSAQPTAREPVAVKSPTVTSAPEEPQSQIDILADSVDDSTNDVNEPLQSPFLSDAKVEKRPLGAFSNEVHNSEPALSTTPNLELETADNSSALDTNIASEPQESTIEDDTPMPAELQPDLLSIEANEDSEPTTPEIVTPAPVAAEAPVGPTSITQQYTPQPSTGDKPVAGIFDTAAYKQPKTNSGKKKTGWLVVLWILLLLVVGAGIGAAIYFFVLPRL